MMLIGSLYTFRLSHKIMVPLRRLNLRMKNMLADGLKRDLHIEK